MKPLKTAQAPSMERILKLGIFIGGGVCLALVSLQASPIFERQPLLLAILPFVCFGVLLLIIQPRYALMGILAIRPLLEPVFNMTRFSVGDQSVSFGAAFNLAIIFLAIYFLSSYAHRITFNSVHVAWFAFLFIMLVSSLYSDYTGRALRLLINFMSYFSMVLIPTLLITNEQEKNYWLKFIFFSSIPTILVGNLDIFSNGYIFRDDGRLQGAFSHPNMMAFYSVVMLIVGILLVFRKACSRVGVTWLFLYMGNLLVLLVLTQTRTAWISLLLFLLIFGVLYERRLLVGLIVLFPLLVFIPPVFDRILDLTQGTHVGGDTKLNSWAWRVYLWKEALPWIERKIWIGYGLTSFPSLSHLFFKNASVGHGIGAHNVYLELVFETGILGCLSFLATYVTPIIQKIRSRVSHEFSKGETIILFAYILSLLVTCMADNILYYLAVNWYGWFFIGILLAQTYHQPILQRNHYA